MINYKLYICTISNIYTTVKMKFYIWEGNHTFVTPHNKCLIYQVAAPVSFETSGRISKRIWLIVNDFTLENARRNETMFWMFEICSEHYRNDFLNKILVLVKKRQEIYFWVYKEVDHIRWCQSLCLRQERLLRSIFLVSKANKIVSVT